MNSRSVKEMRKDVYDRFSEINSEQDRTLTVEIDEAVVCFRFLVAGELRQKKIGNIRSQLGGTVREESAKYLVVVSKAQFELYRITDLDEEMMFQPIIRGEVSNGTYLDQIQNIISADAVDDDLSVLLRTVQIQLRKKITDADGIELEEDVWQENSENNPAGALLTGERDWIANKIATAIVVRVVLGVTLNTVPEYQEIPVLTRGDGRTSTESTEHIASALESVRHRVERTTTSSDRLANIVSEIRELESPITGLVNSLFGLKHNIYNLEGEKLMNALENLVPSSERTRLGGYTDSRRGATLCSIYLQQKLSDQFESDPDILDPACGDGTTLARLARQSERFGTKSFRNYTGIDPDPLAIELARARIVLENLLVAPRNLAFHSVPFQSIRVGESSKQQTLLGNNAEKRVSTQPPVDAIVMQPPMLRAEQFEVDGWREIIKDKYPIEMSNRWDIAAFFLLHATAFLNDGAYFASVIPTDLLRLSSYSPVREFLCNKFDIEALIRLDQDQTYIDTGVTVLYLRRDKSPSSTSDVTIVDLDDADHDPDPEAVVNNILNGTREPTDKYKIIPQEVLKSSDSWLLYFEAPLAYIEWKKRTKKTLSSVSKIKYGIKTGKNSFFFPGDQADRLPEDHLKEAVHRQPGEAKVATSDISTEQLLVLSDDLCECLHSEFSHGQEPNTSTEEILEVCNAEPELIEYITEAEAQGANKGAAVQRRKPWFRLPDRTIKAADVLVPIFLTRPAGALWNNARRLAANTYLELWIQDEFSDQILNQHESFDNNDVGKLISALLNTSLCRAGLYVSGSDRRGGYAQMNSQRLGNLPIPNLLDWKITEREQLCEAFDKLRESPEEYKKQKALDDALQDALDFDIQMETLRSFVWEE